MTLKPVRGANCTKKILNKQLIFDTFPTLTVDFVDCSCTGLALL